jgi:ketosteroid isomerase-like protein
VGTGADEVRVGSTDIRQQLERDMSQADRINLVLEPTRVSVHGEVAWVFAEPMMELAAGGEDIRMTMRMTLVLVKSGDKVLVRSGHLSVPFAGQESGRSFAAG